MSEKTKEIIDQIKELISNHKLDENLIEEFNLISIAKDTHDLPKEISIEIRDKFSTYAKILEDILQPDHSFITMHECSVFNEKELNEVEITLSKLMFYVNAYREADLITQEEIYLSYIKEATIVWKEIKNHLLKIIKKTKDSWNGHLPDKKKQEGYFG